MRVCLFRLIPFFKEKSLETPGDLSGQLRSPSGPYRPPGVAGVPRGSQPPSLGGFVKVWSGPPFPSPLAPEAANVLRNLRPNLHESVWVQVLPA